MRRFLLPVVVLVLAVVLSGCGARSDAGRMAAVQEIAAGDKLLAANDYDGAFDRYVKAANECTANPVYDEAGRKASVALASKVADDPLPKQVAAFQGFLSSLPDAMLPLSAHNWLSNTLRTDAQATVAHAKTVAADDRKLLSGRTSAVKKIATKKPLAKKPVAKKPALAKKGARTATTTPVVATKPATATASAAATIPPFAMLSAAELTGISQALPALGQPPEMQKLYASLAEISAASDACERARGGAPRRPLTLAQRRTLTSADARLKRALQRIDSLLASL